MQSALQILGYNLSAMSLPTAVTDTPLIWSAAKSPAKVTDVWLKQTPAITDSCHYELTDTLLSPDDTILLFFLSL